MGRSFESDDVGIERPELPAMVPDRDASGKVSRMTGDRRADGDGPERPQVPLTVEPAESADQVARRAAPTRGGPEPGIGPSYLRMQLRLQDGETNVERATLVDGPLVTAESAGAGYAYEVTLDGRRLAGESLGELGTRRGLADPTRPERGHQQTGTGQFEFTVRIPTDKLPADALDRVEIALLRVTDASRSLPAIGDRPLLDRYPVEVREVSRVRGPALAGELRRLLP